MARHMSDINEIKTMLDEIPEGTPIISEDLPEEEKEKRKKRLLELTVHASDISFLARPQEAQRL